MWTCGARASVGGVCASDTADSRQKAARARGSDLHTPRGYVKGVGGGGGVVFVSGIRQAAFKVLLIVPAG